MKLIQLEWKKISVVPYLLASILIPLAALSLVELLAYAPRIDPSILATDPEMGTYQFLFFISFVINVAGFSCLGTALLSKVIMESYSDKYIYLTLSYPTARQKVFWAKIFFCIAFCGIGIFIGSLFTNVLFFISESLFPVVNDSLSYSVMLDQLPLLLVSVLLVTSISLISLAIGWWKKSVALAIVSAMVLCSIPSNLVGIGGEGIVTVISGVLRVVSLILVLIMTKKVSRLEA